MNGVTLQDVGVNNAFRYKKLFYQEAFIKIKEGAFKQLNLSSESIH